VGEELLVSSSIVLTFFTVVYSSLGFPIIQWWQMNMDAIGEGEEQGSVSWVWVWSSLDFSKPSTNDRYTYIQFSSQQQHLRAAAATFRKVQQHFSCVCVLCSPFLHPTAMSVWVLLS
jgi:hypothetical protein